MKIVSWNMNGIRSFKRGQSLKTLFDSLDADIICLQETKVTREMLEEEVAIVEGYNAYFSFSKVRSGYSGVATFCHDHVTPVSAESEIVLLGHQSVSHGLREEKCLTNEELEALNAEGRSVLTEHLVEKGNPVVIINLYCPRAELDNKERTEFKLKFYALVEEKCKSLIQENKHVIVLGDFNVSHKLIDHCDPDDPEIFDSNPSRQWIEKFIWDPKKDNSSLQVKFIDSFRYFHPHQESAFTCWSTMTGARKTNYGTRIDYIIASIDFFKKEFTDCVIRPDIEGSDHCPVVATLKSDFQNSRKAPPLCTKYMPEFSGRQQKLKAFFTKCGKKKEINNCEKGNEEKGTYYNAISQKSGGKRLSSLPNSQPKRMKMNTGNSLGSIWKFFDKTGNYKGDTSIVDPDECQSGQACENREHVWKGKEELPQNITNCLEARTEVNEDFPHSLCQNSLSSGEVLTSSCQSQSSSQETKTDSLSALAKNATIPDQKEAAVIATWKNLLKGLPPAPLCSGHQESCVLRTVKNKGPNHGKQFYCCPRPQGHSTNKEARCNFFQWVKK